VRETCFGNFVEEEASETLAEGEGKGFYCVLSLRKGGGPYYKA
jgi:hypothetical protein